MKRNITHQGATVSQNHENLIKADNSKAFALHDFHSQTRMLLVSSNSARIPLLPLTPLETPE